MTGVEFVLPKGYLSPQGQLLRHGTMRLATAKDELEVRADQRAIANPDYGTDTFTLNFPVRLRGVATHYCSRKQRLHPAHHWTRRRYPAKL